MQNAAFGQALWKLQLKRAPLFPLGVLLGLLSWIQPTYLCLHCQCTHVPQSPGCGAENEFDSDAFLESSLLAGARVLRGAHDKEKDVSTWWISSCHKN